MKEMEGSKGSYALVTEGINFPAMYKYHKMLDLNKITSNCVGSFAECYGVEAGANTIKREIDKVFKPYG